MRILLGSLAALLTAFPASSQPSRQPSAPAPIVQLPPELCRIWFRGLRPEQQPRPTDCATARRQARITGGVVVVVGREPGGPLRQSDWDERYRLEQAERDEREQERIKADRDRDWRDGSINDRDWREDLDPWL